MAKSVLILDTSMLCVWLRMPGFDSCGPDQDSWDFNRIEAEIGAAIESHFTLVLPLATIIESGNHIAHSTTLRFEQANALAELIRKAADKTSPWAAFTDQSQLWSPEALRQLADDWPPLAQNKLGIGDATIKHVSDLYSKMGYEVRLLTGDEQLSSYEPAPPPLIPRRRQVS